MNEQSARRRPSPQPSPAGEWSVPHGGLGSVREEQASDNRHRQREVEARHPFEQTDVRGHFGQPTFIFGDLGRLGGFFRRRASLDQRLPAKPRVSPI
jgi:hypothetical protein